MSVCVGGSIVNTRLGIECVSVCVWRGAIADTR